MKEIENVESLRNLQQIDVSGNFISSLKGLDNNSLLETIDLENNHVNLSFKSLISLCKFLFGLPKFLIHLLVKILF